MCSYNPILKKGNNQKDDVNIKISAVQKRS